MSDAIQIRRPEVAAAIRELASLRDVSLTDAVRDAVEAQLARERVQAEEKLRKKRAEVRKVVEEMWSLPRIGPPLTDDDLYDEQGMPK